MPHARKSLESPDRHRDRQLPDQHRELENQNRCGRGGDRKNRLRDPGSEYVVVHVHSPLN
jgi:hypothetical protein